MVQKATLGTTSCRPQAPSVLHCYGVSVWRGSVLEAWAIILEFLVDSETTLRHDQLQAAGAIRPSLPWCFNVVKGSAAGGGSPFIRPGAPWPWHSRRRFSPLRRREGPPPQPPTHPPTACRQKPPRFTVFCARPIFSHFSAFVAQDGSTWANIGLKMGQHSPKLGQHSPQDGPTWPQDGPT